MLLGEDWTQTFHEAQEEAVNNGKKLLLLFTGSHWCPHCRLFKQTALRSGGFENYADSRFVKVLFDFPKSQAARSRVLDMARVLRNLARTACIRVREQFQWRSTFPARVLALESGICSSKREVPR